MFDAFLCLKGPDVPGESQDANIANDADAGFGGVRPFEVISFELGAENNINIGSISSGGGAGKATFKEFNITKKTDTASCELFNKLVTGAHFNDAILVLRRSGQDYAKSGGIFLKFEMKLVMVQDIGWSGSDGDDICEESVVLQYGAIQITYWKQKTDGKHEVTAPMGVWSRVLNEANFSVTPA